MLQVVLPGLVASAVTSHTLPLLPWGEALTLQMWCTSQWSAPHLQQGALLRDRGCWAAPKGRDSSVWTAEGGKGGGQWVLLGLGGAVSVECIWNHSRRGIQGRPRGTASSRAGRFQSLQEGLGKAREEITALPPTVWRQKGGPNDMVGTA